MKRKHGWLPDLPDHRDIQFSAINPSIVLPENINLRDSCPVVYDQGQLGSCTANAIAAAVEFVLKKEKLIDFMPSRLFIYYNERVMENTIYNDNGAQIRDGVKSINKLGVCSEDKWPYVEAYYTINPYERCYKDALTHRSIQYQSINQDLNSIKSCLASGYPIIFGFTVYDHFESDDMSKNPILNVPDPSEHCCGGHAVLCVGYDDVKKQFIVRNSWGDSWGDKGYFYMSYDYMLNQNLAMDFWTIKTMTQ